MPTSAKPGDPIRAAVRGHIETAVTASGRSRADVARACWPACSDPAARLRLHRLIQGSVWPSPDDLAKLSLVLGVPWERLIAGAPA